MWTQKRESLLYIVIDACVYSFGCRDLTQGQTSAQN